MRNLLQRWFVCGMGLALLCTSLAARADTLTWHTNQDRVTADIKSVPLERLLEGVAKLTGWKVYVESNTLFPPQRSSRIFPPATRSGASWEI